MLIAAKASNKTEMVHNTLTPACWQTCMFVLYIEILSRKRWQSFGGWTQCLESVTCFHLLEICAKLFHPHLPTPQKWKHELENVAELWCRLLLYRWSGCGCLNSSQAFKTTWHIFEKPVVLLLNLERHIQESEIQMGMDNPHLPLIHFYT